MNELNSRYTLILEGRVQATLAYINGLGYDEKPSKSILKQMLTADDWQERADELERKVRIKDREIEELKKRVEELENAQPVAEPVDVSEIVFGGNS